MMTVLRLSGVALAATVLAVSVGAQQREAPLIVVGTVMNPRSLGTPVIGETIYFSGVTDGKASLVWTVKDGVALASGILNPKAKTDERGRFRIEVRPDQLPTGKLFTLGTQDDWFRSNDGTLLVFQVPPQPTKGGKRELDVGTIIR
jgi:hypothetical protein